MITPGLYRIINKATGATVQGSLENHTVHGPLESESTPFELWRIETCANGTQSISNVHMNRNIAYREAELGERLRITETHGGKYIFSVQHDSKHEPEYTISVPDMDLVWTVTASNEVILDAFQYSPAQRFSLQRIKSSSTI